LHPPTFVSSSCQKFIPSTCFFGKSKGELVDVGSKPNCGCTVLLQQSWRSFVERFSGCILLQFFDHAAEVEEDTKNKRINKKFWGELIRCFQLIGCRPNGKRRLLFALGTSLSRCYLATIEHFTEHLPSRDRRRYTYRHTD
jgi:hypothetical protein